MEREEKIKCFEVELNFIEDEKLRQFAMELIANADDYFFVVPGSSSGKYHPPFDLGEGGLMRHTKCVAFMTRCLCEAEMVDSKTKDLLIIGALAHDMKKQGEGEGQQHTIWEHPRLAKEYILNMQDAFPNLIGKKDANLMAEAVHSHMGKWGHYEEYAKGRELMPLPLSDTQKILHSADYIASRKEIREFSFVPIENAPVQSYKKVIQVDENKKPVDEMTDEELGDFVLTFGKHKGKPIKLLISTGYLDWVAGQVEFSNRDAQDVIKEYLKRVDGKLGIVERKV